eukprot:SM000077S21588  [mRNA]  locus=s77:430593:431514:+ [translate_table: standard]
MDHLSAPEMIRLLEEEAATLGRMQSHINMELHHLQVIKAFVALRLLLEVEASARPACTWRNSCRLSLMSPITCSLEAALRRGPLGAGFEQVEEALLRQQREAAASQLRGTHGGEAAAGRGKGSNKRKQAVTAEQELATEQALAAELEAVLEAGVVEDG